MHTLICVTFSLPSGVRDWLRLLLVALPGLFCLPLWISRLISYNWKLNVSWLHQSVYLSCTTFICEWVACRPRSILRLFQERSSSLKHSILFSAPVVNETSDIQTIIDWLKSLPFKDTFVPKLIAHLYLKWQLLLISRTRQGLLLLFISILLILSYAAASVSDVLVLI